MKKKEALAIAKRRVKRYLHEDGWLRGLCFIFKESPLENDWNEYWKKINTKKKLSMADYLDHDYFDHECNSFEVGLLRLLTLHFFIEDTYK